MLGAFAYHYRPAGDAQKELIFSSPYSISILSSLSILIVSMAIVKFFPEKKSTEVSLYTPTNNFQVLNANDTTLSELAKHPTPFHYQLFLACTRDSLGEIKLARLQRSYETLLHETDSSVRNTAHFALGALHLRAGAFDSAAVHFDHVHQHDLPYLHYCKGQLYVKRNQPQKAEREFRQELHIANGNFEGALSYLVDLYTKDKRYFQLKELLAYNPSPEIFPDVLRRHTYLTTGDYTPYGASLLSSVWHSANTIGFMAALLIGGVWFVYVFKLSIFETHPSPWPMLVLFFGGALSTLPCLVYVDLHSLYIPWEADHTFWNDLLYAIVMIGIPEEFVKIVPVFFFLLVMPRVNEPIHYIRYAAASALGFAFVENLLYFENLSTGIIHGRAYLSVIGHMIASSVVIYGFVLGRFKLRKTNRALIVSLGFVAGAVVHGLYDFLIMQNLTLFFVIYFIFMVQVWIIIINNCLNQSPRFSYARVGELDKSKYVAIALTAIFAFEYLLVAFVKGPEKADYEFYASLPFAGTLIIFFLSNLGSFNVVRGYWRDIYFSSREKKGYGTLNRGFLLTSWYFVNAIRAHNYVGQRVSLCNDPYNKNLQGLLEDGLEGSIVTRVVLKEKDDLDPHWFVVKLDQPFPFETANQRYVLVKLRNQNDSLLHEDEVQIFFKSIPDLDVLKSRHPRKDAFPFHGWVLMSLLIGPVSREVS
ncbi:PrsW family glutamic-type intramembrane protease [Chryseolinea lacunae]|uniref:PrsW family intramembrane metalloprotease n=1 Tax=Chryseolinea lacunae TaxID=2801331 RepID=A0ABS1KTK9_9BACT|nr:PrsW family glutamic-type intramembrane protease [Chryseolinea lacunae]MBL0742027.1 PrsW family intramembrane metalloprotease [Chryseolinea lacunae]